MDYDVNSVDRLSGTTPERRDRQFRWLGKQGDLARIEAVKRQTDLIRKHREQAKARGIPQTNTPEFLYAIYSVAVKEMISLETAHQRKGAQLRAERFAKVREMRIDAVRKRRKRASLKKEVIDVRFYALIQGLFEQGLSLRETSDYLARHEKFKISFSYLREIFNKLRAERQMSSLLPRAE